MLRVLHVGPAVGTQGGIAAVIEELCLAPSEDEVDAYATWWPQSPARSFLAAMRLAIFLPWIARRYDVIHVHLSEKGSFIREGGIVLVAAAYGKLTAATLHGAGFPEFASTYYRLVRAVLRKAAVVFCLGARSASVAESFAPGRCQVVYNPVRARGLPNRTNRVSPTVLFAGLVGERKGFDILLAAWPIVLNQVPEAVLRVAGPLDPRQTLPHDDDHFKYLGILSRADVELELRTSKVTVLPSRREVLPMIVLESLAEGVPAIVSSAGEMTELASCSAVTVLDLPVGADELAFSLVLRLRREDSSAAREASSWSEAHTFSGTVSNSLTAAYQDALVHRAHGRTS